MTALNARDQATREIRNELEPFLDERLEALKQFAEGDLPLLKEMQTHRLQSVKQTLNDADATMVEKARSLLEAVAQKGETLCIFMGLKDVQGLVSFCKEWYPGETPACIVYKAGYSDSEGLVRTTLDGFVDVANRAREKFLRLIYVGPCLA